MEQPETIVTSCIRSAFGEALVDYGEINPDIVVLDADLSSATRTVYFARRFPERFFNFGIAESGMVDAGVGFALGGKIPFVSTFASLISLRAAEEVRTCVAYARANVKLAAAYGGFCAGFDGPTHQSECDLAVMRSIPHMTIVVASDAMEARQFVPLVAEFDGPVYFRLSRAIAPLIFDQTHQVEIGKGITLREGGDITLIGTGLMVARCLWAAEELEKADISARVLEIHTLKPLDKSLILQAARETKGIVTAEEHSIIGGLGSAVAEVLAEHPGAPLVRIGIADCFAESGPHEVLLDHFGMGVKDIVMAGKKVLCST